jgi:Zn-dependent peptidase ImmA (M78 family)
VNSHSRNSKERLFEVFEKVNKINLNENILSVDDKNKLIKEFIDYVDKEIGLNGNRPTILITYEKGVAKEWKSFGGYIPNQKTIKIVCANRNLADICRTLGHELIHYKQDIDGKLNQDSGKTGSDCENEANSLAGVLMRNFGKINPEIFE